MELQFMAPQLIQNIQHRQDVMRSLLYIICLGGICFFCMNIYRQVYFLAILELAFSIYAMVVLRAIATTKHFQRWVIAFVIPLFSFIVYALSLEETSKMVFVWTLSFPIVSYLLLGKKAGIWVSLFFISTSLLIYHLKFLNLQDSLSIAESLNVVFSSALMIAFAHVYEKNREENEARLLDLAATDSLTGVHNRLKLYESYALWSENVKGKSPILSVALVDLDHFKNINDQYGHSVGDLALRHVANFIQKRTHNNIMLARIGGEEFALKMMNTSLIQGYELVEKLRVELSNTPLIVDNETIKITFSAGVSTYGDDGISLDALLANADKRLYVAKAQGRNCVFSTVAKQLYAICSERAVNEPVNYKDNTEKSELF
jgi:diguanylate cyclase (GGDEF)-like protein